MFQKFGAKMIEEEKPNKEVVKAETVVLKAAPKPQLPATPAAPATEEEGQPHYECFRF